jgi:hypothetical protein
MGAQNLVQLVIAAVALVNACLWLRMALRHDGLLRVISIPPLSWCVHVLLRYVVLFGIYLSCGAVLNPEQARFFSWWTTVINLHGVLSCLTLLYFVRDWRSVDGRS